MAPRGIPEKLHQIVLDLAGEGKSSRAIAEQLGAEHGHKTTYSTVARLLKELRKDRADIAKAVVREELAPALTRDLRRLERFAKRCANRAHRCGDDIVFAKLVDELRKITETKLKFSGANEPDVPLAPLNIDFSNMSDAELKDIVERAATTCSRGGSKS